MQIMLDTNILLRISQPSHQHHSAVMIAIATASQGGADFCISSQSIYEFFAVATRPVVNSGLGMDQASADSAIDDLIGRLTLFYDSADVVALLRHLVLQHRVSGKSVHDARIVATMLANKVSQLMTINVADFKRYPELSLIDPRVVNPASFP